MITDPNIWRVRADRYRALARGVTHESTRASYEKLASSCDIMAGQIENARDTQSTGERTKPAQSHFSRCGLPGIDVIPYGMHACHFYRDRDELVSALVPYFVAGLSANERCIWITAPNLPAREARVALSKAWERTDYAIQSGALRIVDFDEWYRDASGGLKGSDLVKLWLNEEERALAEGYNGLRITGNLSFLQPGDWSEFMDYERMVSPGFHTRRIIALCSYTLDQCDDQQRREVMLAHDCTLHRHDADWLVVSNAESFANVSR